MENSNDVIINIPTDIVNYISDMTIAGMVEQEVRAIRRHLMFLRPSRYYMTRAGIHQVRNQFVTSAELPPTGFVERDQPIWYFRMTDRDPLLPIFNEYVRQLSPVLASQAVVKHE